MKSVKTQQIIVMGVAGSGKSTIASSLARYLGWRFVEGDDIHPQENVAKMSKGIALDDNDRAGWLLSIRQAMDTAAAEGVNCVVACSALKLSLIHI